eukprot:g21336.t1
MRKNRLSIASGAGFRVLEDSEVGEDQREASRYPFDCRLERDGWDINWSKEKKEYCCSAVNFGCATEPFDCELQKDQFKTVWTPQKSAYCCDQHGFACDHAAQGCDRICHIFGQSASCQARAMHAFSKVGSCAQAHREVLDQCWVCDGCPAQGLNCADAKEKEEKEEKEKEEREKQKKEREKEQRDKDKMEKEEEERQKEEEEEEEEALRKGERDAWKLDRNKLPCHEPAKHGYMWRFDTKSSKHHWEQLPMEHGAHNTPAGRGFMWRKEGYNWMQVCIPFPSAEHLPNVPVGEGFMWHRRQIWQQIPMTLHDAGKIGTVPKIPAGPGFWWKRVNGEWKQVPLPKDMRNRERPCNLRSGPGMRWVFRAAGGTAWQQLLIPGWKSHSVNPQPGVPPGEGFMWSFEPQDQGWTQICIPGPAKYAYQRIARPPTLEAGTGFMWVHQGGSWHQLPVPRGLRRSCMEQPTESFAPAGQGFMWKCLRKDGLLAWHQVHRNTWHEDGPSKPSKDKPGTGLMWVYQDDYWQQQPIPGWISKQAPHLPAGPGLMWTRTTMNGVHVWRQDLIPDWEVDNRLHPPAEPAGEGMMWRYDEKNRKEWKQVRIGDWYSDSANHPPSEYAGNGLMWKFVSVDKNPGEWQQVDIPDWHVLDQFKLPNEAAGPGFMWKFDKDIGRWKQLPIPRWREDARIGYMWKYIKENAKDHWEQIQLPKSELLRQHPEPSEPAGKYFRWQYKTDGDRDHWEQVESYARMSELRKGIFLLLAHQYEVQKSALVELRALFTHFDVRNQGCLSAQDLKGVLVKSGMGGVAAERVCHALDRRRDGQITWTASARTEFTAAAMWYVVCRNNKAIDAAFATFDSDQERTRGSFAQKDGRVTAKDLQMVLADVRGQEAWRKQMPHMFEEMEKQEISSLRRMCEGLLFSIGQASGFLDNQNHFSGGFYIQSCSDFPPHSRILMWNFEKRLQEDSLLQFRATVSFVFKQVPHYFRGSWQTSKKKAQRDSVTLYSWLLLRMRSQWTLPLQQFSKTFQTDLQVGPLVYSGCVNQRKGEVAAVILACVWHQALEKAGPMTQLDYVLDAHGYQPLLNLNMMPYLRLARSLNSYFAERFHRIIVLDMPTVLSVLVKAIVPLLPPKTRQKLFFVRRDDPDSLNALYELCTDQELELSIMVDNLGLYKSNPAAFNHSSTTCFRR